MITGPAPNIGKSFISANLAAVLASSGKKVLLIDGDLRKGKLHQYFGIPRDSGLAELIAGDSIVLQPTGVDNIDIIPTGQLPRNPSDLLLLERFGTALKQLAGQYDLVIIDTPPVLAVSDVTIIGQHVGTTLLVLKANIHNSREIKTCIRRLKLAGIRPRGILFNSVENWRRRYGYGNYYGYSYT